MTSMNKTLNKGLHRLELLAKGDISLRNQDKVHHQGVKKLQREIRIRVVMKVYLC